MVEKLKVPQNVITSEDAIKMAYQELSSKQLETLNRNELSSVGQILTGLHKKSEGLGKKIAGIEGDFISHFMSVSEENETQEVTLQDIEEQAKAGGISIELWKDMKFSPKLQDLERMKKEKKVVDDSIEYYTAIKNELIEKNFPNEKE